MVCVVRIPPAGHQSHARYSQVVLRKNRHFDVVHVDNRKVETRWSHERMRDAENERGE